jgi:hypothetical protein
MPAHAPGQEDLLDDAQHARLLEAQRLRAHDGRVDQVQSQRVGAVAVHDEHGVGVVLEPLGHLLAVLREHQPVDDEVREGGPVEQRGGEHHQRVEPAARLVQALGDEGGGEAVLQEALGVLERVVDLRVGHGARLEPAVEDLCGRAGGRRQRTAKQREEEMV